MFIVAAVGVGSVIGLGCWLVGNPPAAVADWQSVSSRRCTHKSAAESGRRKE